MQHPRKCPRRALAAFPPRIVLLMLLTASPLFGYAAPAAGQVPAAAAQMPAALQQPSAPQQEAVGLPRLIEEMVIVGSRRERDRVLGAAHYIGAERLARYAYADIQRILREVPGVSLQLEDGYGLRPNISLRGVATERSSRITLLEDNILIAPAPYSAPSAYYFPTPGRMAAVEVVKGPAAITQGPYTIGGAVNMLSTPIPASPEGALRLEAGGDRSHRLHATYGGTYDIGGGAYGDGGRVGFLLETHQWRSDGFQNIDRVSRDTGLHVRDYTLKLGYSSPDDRHSLQLKLQYADQDSNQSYLGLTDADLKADPHRRYGLSALDNISTAHRQQMLSYRYNGGGYGDGGGLRLSATVYNNEHERDWFKTEGLDFDGSAGAGAVRSWFSVVQAVNASSGFERGGDLESIAAAALQAVLDGSADTAPGSIQLRSNARQYFSRGMQLKLGWHLSAGRSRHEIELGLRYHEDQEDRLQRDSSYHQEDGALVLDDIGMLGSAGNRIQEAEAYAFHLYDRIERGDWVFTPGLRYEDIKQQRVRYETRAGRTADPASRAADNLRDRRRNRTRVWLPGLGVSYRLSDANTLVGGVHKGFTAPSNAPGVDEEEALNYEFGIRHDGGRAQAEVMLFFSDYENLLGECTSSSGAGCEVGDAFNGDAAAVYGVELSYSTDLVLGPAWASGFLLPLSVGYTHIKGEFKTDIASTDFFGDVGRGDPLPYLPPHRLSAELGLERGGFSVYLALDYADGVCVRASCGEFERSDSSLTLDLSARYLLQSGVTLYGRVENLGNSNDIVGRHPYGARPSRGRTAALGMTVAF